MRAADEIFLSELQKRGIAYTDKGDGNFDVDIGQVVTVSLENIRRNFQRDGDASDIQFFVEKLVNGQFMETPDWQSVQPFIRYSLEPNDYESGFDEVLFNKVTDDLIQVFVYTSADGSRISWVNLSTVEEWGVRREQVVQQAEENMSRIVAATKLEVQDVDGTELGMVSTIETPFKASLILSPAFRELVFPTHQWPVLVVVPCRDFAYVVRDDDRGFLSRLGRVVLREYRSSGHPLTKDVLRVSTEGISAIGTFPDSAAT